MACGFLLPRYLGLERRPRTAPTAPPARRPRRLRPGRAGARAASPPSGRVPGGGRPGLREVEALTGCCRWRALSGRGCLFASELMTCSASRGPGTEPARSQPGRPPQQRSARARGLRDRRAPWSPSSRLEARGGRSRGRRRCGACCLPDQRPARQRRRLVNDLRRRRSSSTPRRFRRAASGWSWSGPSSSRSRRDRPGDSHPGAAQLPAPPEAPPTRHRGAGKESARRSRPAAGRSAAEGGAAAPAAGRSQEASGGGSRASYQR